MRVKVFAYFENKNSWETKTVIVIVQKIEYMGHDKHIFIKQEDIIDWDNDTEIFDIDGRRKNRIGKFHPQINL